MHHQLSALRRCALAAFAAAAPGLAFADFSPPVTLSQPGDYVTDPRVGSAANGRSVATWRRFDGTNNRVQARARSVNGTLGPILNLSAANTNARRHNLAVEADGDAIAVWVVEDGRVQARVRSAAGALGPILNISPAGTTGSDPGVAVDADGDALFVWNRVGGGDGRVQIRSLSKTGILGPVESISLAAESADFPRLAMEPDGDALVSWVDGGGPIQARVRSKTGQLSAIRTISNGSVRAAATGLDIDADGDAVIVWERFGTPNSPQLRGRSKIGELGPVQTAAPSGASQIQVLLAANGDGLLVWQQRVSTFDARIQARSRAAGGTLGTTQNISAGVNGFNPDAAMTAAGDAVMTWVGEDSPGDRFVRARTRSAAGALGPVRTLSGISSDILSTRVALDADGDALVVWERWNGSSYVIEASSGP